MEDLISKIFLNSVSSKVISSIFDYAAKIENTYSSTSKRNLKPTDKKKNNKKSCRECKAVSDIYYPI
jgi:hypothetical protein